MEEEGEERGEIGTTAQQIGYCMNNNDGRWFMSIIEALWRATGKYQEAAV